MTAQERLLLANVEALTFDENNGTGTLYRSEADENNQIIVCCKRDDITNSCTAVTCPDSWL